MEKEIKDLQDKLDALMLKYEQSKQPFKNGDVVNHLGGSIVLITDFENKKGYGVNGFGEWQIKNEWSFTNFHYDWQLATQEEWLEALTNEAVKRYKVGDKVKTFDNGIIILEGVSFDYDNTSVYATSVQNDILLKNGVWAEVIKEETLEELVSRYYKCDTDLVTFFNENKKTINRLSK